MTFPNFPITNTTDGRHVITTFTFLNVQRRFKGNGGSKMQRAWETMVLGNNVDYTLRGSLAVFFASFFLLPKKMKKGALNNIAILKSTITAKK